MFFVDVYVVQNVFYRVYGVMVFKKIFFLIGECCFEILVYLLDLGINDDLFKLYYENFIDLKF